MQRMEEYHFWLATKSKHLGTDIDNSYWGGACKEYTPYPFNFTSAPTPAVVRPSPSPTPKPDNASAAANNGSAAGHHRARVLLLREEAARWQYPESISGKRIHLYLD